MDYFPADSTKCNEEYLYNIYDIDLQRWGNDIFLKVEQKTFICLWTINSLQHRGHLFEDETLLVQEKQTCNKESMIF